MIRFGEFFCGPGGIGKGFELASSEFLEEFQIPNFETIHSFANDLDFETCETFRHNIEIDPRHVYCGDVRTLDLNILPRIDGFAFGFPCNDFSIVGEQRGLDGEYGPLYSYGVGLIENQNPDFFVAENVGGITSSNEGQAFQLIINALRNAGEFGYNLSINLYRFEKYGIPQARHRVIIVGFRNDLNLRFRVPAMTHDKNQYVTCSQAILTPPIPANAPNNELTAQHQQVIDRLNHILPGRNAFNSDLPEHLTLNVRGAQLSQIYKRLHPDQPSYTVTGSGGGGTHVYHWEEPRALTNRERARLQTFPDDFVFLGKKESVRKQIGMAVPVLGAKIIFKHIFKTLNNIEYDHIEDNLNF